MALTVSAVFLIPASQSIYTSRVLSSLMLTWSILTTGSLPSISFSTTDTLVTLLDNDNLLQAELLSQFTMLSLLQSLNGRFLRLGAWNAASNKTLLFCNNFAASLASYHLVLIFKSRSHYAHYLESNRLSIQVSGSIPVKRTVSQPRPLFLRTARRAVRRKKRVWAARLEARLQLIRQLTSGVDL